MHPTHCDDDMIDDHEWVWTNATDVVPGELLLDEDDDWRICVVVGIMSLLDSKYHRCPELGDNKQSVVWTLGSRGLKKQLVNRYHFGYFKRLL